MAHLPPMTFVRFSTRLGVSAALCYGTYNPSGTSYIHWLLEPGGGYLSLKVMVGLFLVWTFMGLVPIIWTSMGPVGIGAAVALMATGGLVLWDYGLLDHIDPSFYPYALIGAVATILAVALTWGHISLQFWHLKLVRKITAKPP